MNVSERRRILSAKALLRKWLATSDNIFSILDVIAAHSGDFDLAGSSLCSVSLLALSTS